MREHDTHGLATVMPTLAIALVLLLGAGTAQAVPMVLFDDSSDLTKATGILDLEIEGFALPFNVEFVGPAQALEIYGPFPGDLVRLEPFGTFESAKDAVDAANLALSAANALSVGEADGGDGSLAFNVGVITFLLDRIGDISVEGIAVIRSALETGEWMNLGEDFVSYDADEGRVWAVFTPVPEPGTALLMVLGLAGLGLAGRPRPPRAQR